MLPLRSASITPWDEPTGTNTTSSAVKPWRISHWQAVQWVDESKAEMPKRIPRMSAPVRQTMPPRVLPPRLTWGVRLICTKLW